MKNILAAIDFSDVTDAVLQNAKSLAKAYDAKLHIIHAAAPEPAFVGYEAGAAYESERRDQTLSKEREKLALLAGDLHRQGVAATHELTEGPTIDVILEEIQNHDSDLLVMGSHGHGALYNLIAGSTTQAALKQVKIPILVVPAHAKK